MNLLLGADPEFFVKKDNVNVSAHELVPGTKSEPYRISGGHVQVDGTAIEFNIDPAKSSFEFSYNIEGVLSQIRDMVPKEYSFDYKPSVRYSKSLMDSLPDKAKELGCEPDYSAYSIEPQRNARPNTRNLMRTGAGHIHIGWTEKMDPFDLSHYWDCRQVTLQMNNVVSPLSKLWDSDENRPSMYGNGPTLRPKPYGVEYRTPSNAWLNYPKLWGWFYDLAESVLENMQKGKYLQHNLRNYISYYGSISSNKLLEAYENKRKEFGFPALPENWESEKIKIV